MLDIRAQLKFFVITTAATAFVFFNSICPALADIYSFTDAKGVVHYTNVLTDPRYKRVPGILSFRRPLSRPRPVPALTTPRSSFDPSVEAHIQAAAQRYAIDPLLIKAVIKQESNFNPNAISKKGALGLMQLMPGTARDMEVADVFDPRDNIFGGTRYLSRLSTQFNGDLILTLASYNAGPERVTQAAYSIPNIPETRNYVRNVLSLYSSYKRYE